MYELGFNMVPPQITACTTHDIAQVCATAQLADSAQVLQCNSTSATAQVLQYNMYEHLQVRDRPLGGGGARGRQGAARTDSVARGSLGTVTVSE